MMPPTVKFHQPLQSTLTTIQLRITRGHTRRGANENVTPSFIRPSLKITIRVRKLHGLKCRGNVDSLLEINVKHGVAIDEWVCCIIV